MSLLFSLDTEFTEIVLAFFDFHHMAFSGMNRWLMWSNMYILCEFPLPISILFLYFCTPYIVLVICCETTVNEPLIIIYEFYCTTLVAGLTSTQFLTIVDILRGKMLLNYQFLLSQFLNIYTTLTHHGCWSTGHVASK